MEQLRAEVDGIDARILDLLNERLNLVKKIGFLKSSSQSQIYRPERENYIIERLKEINREKGGILNNAAIEALFFEIFAVSRNYELPEKIAYLGPEGSFTHQAAESRFGAMSEYLPLATIESIFESVNAGRAKFGVVPFENNQEGVVNETIDNLGKFEVHIIAEMPLPIHFAFATLSDKVEEIEKIYSRDIAFRQCKKFIDTTFHDRKVEMAAINSTSGAVKLALEDRKTAAICSHIAARIYKLPILFDNVEDSADNFTRFLIIGKDFKNVKVGNDKTSILTMLPDEPGSLVNFLQDFYDARINLTKIESRPAKEGKKFKYWFYIDFEGHIDDENVKEVMKKYRKNTKWLGSYLKLC
ncbi:MAG TPA: prephenate dehydratase [Cyclobacteriaceae bacterium]|nr:prephenate dehydratase [Cyclobacteriaceae bacterium]